MILIPEVKYMIKFILGASGTGKTTHLFELIRKSAENNRKQCVIVPEQYSYEFDKNLYGFIGAEKFNGIISTTFTGLARQIFQIYGEPDRKGEYADEMAKMIMIHQALSEVRKNSGSVKFFSHRLSHNGFAEDFSVLIDNFGRSGVTPDMLRKKSQFLDKKLSEKTNDVAFIYEEYLKLMREYGFKDNLDNIREASKIANLQKYFSGFDVYIDEFESFNGDQLDMIKVIASSADNFYISLRSDNINAGKYSLFETVNNTYSTIKQLCSEMNLETECFYCNQNKPLRFKYSDLEYLSTNIMRNNNVTLQKPLGNITVFEAKDMYMETEYVCATVKKLISSDKTLKYRDIAIISNNIGEYSDILKSSFSRYEIPYFLSIEKPVKNTSVMMFFISLIDILTAKNFRSEQIFRFVKCGVIEKDLTETAMLENYCYRWGIDGKLWEEPFTAEDKNLEIIENFRKTLTEPLKILRNEVKKEHSAVEICTFLYNYLVECNAEQNIAETMSGLVKKNLDYEANEIKRIWGCIIDILDSIADTLGERKISFSEMAMLIKSMAGKINYSVPPQTVDSVITASARTARLNSPRVIFVMGASDGDFPDETRTHGLFSEYDMEKLADSGTGGGSVKISRPMSDLIASERLIVYKSFSTASEKLYVTYPLSDLSGSAKYPSQVIGQIKNMFGEDIVTTEESVPVSYYASTMHSAFYHYMQNIKENSSDVATLKYVLGFSQDYSRRIENILKKSGHENNYHVESDTMCRLKEFSPFYISPTDLENYNKCHFMHFCSNFLKLEKLEKVDIDARVSGDIAHECFQKVLSGHSKKEFIELKQDELEKEIRKSAEEYRDLKMAGEFAKSPEFQLVFNKLVERLNLVFVRTQQALSVSDFKPVQFELNINSLSSLTLPFGENKRLIFGGQIDRIDIYVIGDEKYIRIIDYKSSEKTIDENYVSSGINMQLLLYLFAITEEKGLYAGYIPSGVLYSPIQISSVESDDGKEESFNEKAVQKNLCATGLVLSDMKVVSAMENGVSGKFIPVSLKGGEISPSSSCITLENMYRLKDYVYMKLAEMAESVFSGNAEAVPVKIGESLPCDYCNYSDICGNGNKPVYRVPDPESVEEVKGILGKNEKKKEDKSKPKKSKGKKEDKK